MNISLYNFLGDPKVANKLKDLSPVYSGDITPYGSFDSQSVVFRLDTEYVCNYAQWGFNGNTYMGYVNVSVDSEGLYVYKMTVDPLTTCWYKRCFNKGNILAYQPNGTSDIRDPRVSYETKTDIKVYHYINELPSYAQTQFVLTVCTNTPFGYNSSTRQIDLSTHTNNAMFDSYIMTGDVLHRTLKRLYSGEHGFTAEDCKNYMPSIVGLYQLRRYEPVELYDIFGHQNYEMDDKIYLHSINFTGYDASNAIENKSLALDVHAGVQDKCARVSCLAMNDDVTSPGGYISFEINPIEYNPSIADTQITLHVPDSGNLEFTLGAVMGRYASNVPKIITNVGYRYDYDFVSGNKRIWPVITVEDIEGNHDIYHYREYSIETPIKLQAPVAIDTSLTNWKGMAQSVVSSSIGLAASVAGTVATGGAMAPTLLSTASNFLSTMNNVQQAQFNERCGGYAQVGSVGGSSEWKETPYITIYQHKPVNLGDIQAKWGKPDFKNRNVESIATATPGYYQTQGCQLNQNGLPIEIIKAAEQSADSGFITQ